MPPRKESKVYEKYRIISNIGKGGFSDVYKVESLAEPGKFYALKYFVIKGDTDKENTIKRFHQEIKLYKSINSQRIAKYVDSYTDEEEQFLVMEFVDGESLKTQISKSGKLLARTAVNYAMQIAEGMGELHNNKIIHRDIKSNNIMITKDRNVKIIDFGLALGEDSQRYTQDQKVIGSVYYMAPELCVASNKPTIKSDIYALGILLYEMLTGTYPFKGASAAETLQKQKKAELPNILKVIEIPQSLANVIYKATNKDPNKRHASMWELREDLQTSTHQSRYYEKPYDAKRDKPKRTLQDVINSKVFLYSSIITITLLLIIGIILAVVLI
ncbi:serine/threonine-protein kinase [Mycoplasma simbae]|uniref:serine/threonine-protein kinase n=1 Tax=Mycoplasma simbae TaxID=36744 RepID=UPI000497BA7D|nr:serine/threonine-protein kinase [Mycoplasma simbae]